MLRVFGHRKSLWLWRLNSCQQIQYCTDRPAHPDEIKLQKKWFKAIAQEDKLKRKQFKALGRAAILLGIGLSGLLVYHEVKSFHGRFQTITNVFDIEREQETYIYTPTDDEHDHPDPRNRTKKVLKKMKEVMAPWFAWLHVQTRSHDPKTLLKLAQSSNHNVRLMGIKALAAHHNWHDADYRRLAQSMDKRTTIGLARTKNVDRRFFMPPPNLPTTDEPIEDQFRQLLAMLPVDGIDQCTRFFTSTALKGGRTVSPEERGGIWCFGGSGLGFVKSMSPVPPERVELFCLQALAKHALGWFWLFNDTDLLTLQTKTLSSDASLAVYFFEALYAHSQVPSHCAKIVELGGLQLLQRIFQLRRTSLKIQRNIARVISNLSIHEGIHNDIVRAGWVSILTQWLRSPDLAISLHAAKTLANLDMDFGIRPYVDGVYLYYPVHRYSEPVYADIVFVHGLLGGPFRTWRQQDRTKTEPQKLDDVKNEPEKTEDKIEGIEDKLSDAEVENVPVEETTADTYTFCWPKDWLAEDVPNIRILTVEYETHLSEWSPRCPYQSEKRSLAVRSAEILTKLRQAGVGDRPVIWVGHSMGGLLIKQLLVTASREPSLQGLVEKSHGIVLFGVPHKGSPLSAASNQAKFLVYPSVEVQELKQGSEMLEHLHKNFHDLMFDQGIPLLSFAEGKKTETQLNMKIYIVPEESSDPGFGEFHLMKDLNHLNICKPKTRQSPLYKLTLEFIRDCIPVHLVEHILRASFFSDTGVPEDKPPSS